MTNRDERLDWLEAHRELEYLRSVGRVTKRREPPKSQQEKIKMRAQKLDDTLRAQERRKKRGS